MKVIIAGSRGMPFSDYHLIKESTALFASAYGDITEVVCGEAIGADTLGKKWAFENNIPVKSFPVSKRDWKVFGKSAGHLRNWDMAEYADGLIVLIYDDSPGSSNMLKQMQGFNKPCYVRYLRKGHA